jgi:drug/metabolite transporter (DMT)-like permease
MTTASGRFRATKASAMAFLIPPVALVLGVVVRGEVVAGLAVAGSALCVNVIRATHKRGVSSSVRGVT